MVKSTSSVMSHEACDGVMPEAGSRRGGTAVMTHAVRDEEALSRRHRVVRRAETQRVSAPH